MWPTAWPDVVAYVQNFTYACAKALKRFLPMPDYAINGTSKLIACENSNINKFLRSLFLLQQGTCSFCCYVACKHWSCFVARTPGVKLHAWSTSASALPCQLLWTICQVCACSGDKLLRLHEVLNDDLIAVLRGCNSGKYQASLDKYFCCHQWVFAMRICLFIYFFLYIYLFILCNFLLRFAFELVSERVHLLWAI